MQIFFSDTFPLPLPAEHRFPIAKYRLLREAVQAERLVDVADLRPAPRAPRAALLRVHTADYLERVLQGTLSAAEQRRIGFPWSPAFVERTRRSTGGTLQAAIAAHRDGLAVHLAGGTHHAHADHGQGFCVFNDAAVAVRALQAAGAVQRAIIVDCDVHQGNGTAAIFAADPTVFTYSIHGARNFPFRKAASDLDVALDDDADDAGYLDALEATLPEALVAAQANFAVYIAGADPYADDRLGRLAVTRRGLVQRDRFVLRQLRAARLPLVIVMGGGYARRVADTVAIQLATVRLAARGDY
jgi:acetoin utilization deacetylase AcuC-like enzyme